MADSVYERVLSVKNEVFVYKIPARTSNRGYRAADWTLDQPSWTGRMRIVAVDKKLQLKLEDRTSGELFAMCSVDSYPGLAVEQVIDSSRYFVIRIEDGGGRHAFIGIGFTDRADSFDLLVSMQDHFKWIKRDEKEALEGQANMQDSGPKLDLGFKEGQTITINLGSINENRKPRPRTNAAGGTPGLLPPPPGGVKLPGPPRIPSAVTPPSGTIPTQPAMPTLGNSHHLVDFGGLTPQPAQTVQPTQPAQSNLDPWGDFTSASSEPTSTAGGDPWVQF